MKNMRIFQAAVAFAACLAANAAEISQGTAKLVAYPFSDPNPVPAVAEKSYPYFRYDGSSAEGGPRDFRVVRMSNGIISLELLPDIGGKVWGATDAKSGADFIYRNHSAKFRNIAMRGPWNSGGIEYNFGIIGHGPYTSSPVDFLARTNADGSVSCFISMTEFICRTTYQVEVRLGDGDDFFTTRTTWHNGSGLPVPYYHWMNAALPVADDMVLKFDGKNEIGHQGDAHPWPVDGMGRDLRKYSNNAFGHNKSYHVINGDNARFGVWYGSRGIGFLHENEPCDKYGRKAWIWALSREGAIWEDLLTDGDGQYVELQSGRGFNQPRFDTVRTPFKHLSFAPGLTDRFAERWGVVRSEDAFAPKGPNPPSEARPRPVESPADFDWNGVYGHFLRGRQAILEREDGLGEKELRAALALDPNCLPALGELSLLELRRGRFGDARELAEKALSIDTYDAAANYSSGLASKSLGDFATAKERLGVASFSGEYRNAAYAALARIAVAERDFGRAVSLSDRILASDGANRDALLAKTVALRLSGRKKEALAAARRALEEWPLFFAAECEAEKCGASAASSGGFACELREEALLETATWYRDTGLEADAREFEKMAGDYPLAKIRLGDYDAAAALSPPLVFPFRREDIAALDAAVAAHPSWKFRYYRAAIAASFQDDATADCLLDSVGDDADEWSFYVFRAQRRSGAGRLSDLKKAESFSRDWRIGRELAAHFLAEGKPEDSLAAARRFLALNPGCNALQIACARALNACGKWRETVEFLKGVNILPSEFGDNACDLWQEAWRALGDAKMAATYPENLGKGKPYEDETGR